jgi:hypothetical protein
MAELGMARPLLGCEGMSWTRGRRMDRRRFEVILCLAMGLPLTAFFIATRVPYPVEKLRPGWAGGTWVPLDRVAPIVTQATLAGEDHRFAEHDGVDGAAMIRALWLAARHGRVMSGGSTITMQLVRLVEPHPKSVVGKLVEIVEACRLERAVSKADILEQYLNRAYYGNGAWGIEDAARRYFGKPAAALTPGEGTLLAVLPRAPLNYDPYRHRTEALERRRQVLDLMEKRGWIDGVGRAAAESQTLVLAPSQRASAVGVLSLSGRSLADRDRSSRPTPADGDGPGPGPGEPAWLDLRWRPLTPTIEPAPRAPRIDPRPGTQMLAKIEQDMDQPRAHLPRRPQPVRVVAMIADRPPPPQLAVHPPGTPDHRPPHPADERHVHVRLDDQVNVIRLHRGVNHPEPAPSRPL